MKIKAITLWQPWASLVAIGAKQIETRSWPTNYRGHLAIHAAQRFPKWAKEIATGPGFATALVGAGYYGTKDLPRGAVICVCRLVDCRLIDGPPVSVTERIFGDYTPGRYAWILEDVRPMPEPIPEKGKQGLWTWEVPEGVKLP